MMRFCRNPLSFCAGTLSCSTRDLPRPFWPSGCWGSSPRDWHRGQPPRPGEGCIRGRRRSRWRNKWTILAGNSWDWRPATKISGTGSMNRKAGSPPRAGIGGAPVLHAAIVFWRFPQSPRVMLTSPTHRRDMKMPHRMGGPRRGHAAASRWRLNVRAAGPRPRRDAQCPRGSRMNVARASRYHRLWMQVRAAPGAPGSAPPPGACPNRTIRWSARCTSG